MGFVVFFFLSWLAITIYAVIKKKLDMVENTLIYLIILVISINFSWIIIEEMKLVTVTQKGLPYTAYLLNRSIIIPIFILLHLNLLIRTETFIKKAIVLISSVLLLVFISFLSTYLGNTEFKKWTLWYEAIYLFGLHFLAILSYRLFKKIL